MTNIRTLSEKTLAMRDPENWTVAMIEAPRIYSAKSALTDAVFVVSVHPHHYTVFNHRSGKTWTVNADYCCTCPSYDERYDRCKHVAAVRAVVARMERDTLAAQKEFLEVWNRSSHPAPIFSVGGKKR